MDRSFILQGHICYTPETDALVIRENAYAVCEEGVCRGVFDEIPERFSGLEVIDCSGRLIIPGLTDLHIHAPQFTYRGTGMDYELLDWLDRVTFPEEIRYADTAYAAKAYGIFAEEMKMSATARAVVFGTIHTESTLILAERMEQSGLVSFVGKVSMDRGAPPQMLEQDAASAADAERRFIAECAKRRYRRTKPIVTPRFVPACSDELMALLGRIRDEYGLPVQSHLSESPEEVELVRKMAPDAAFYGDAYDRFGLFGLSRGESSGSPERFHTVMAHCVWSAPEETQRIPENGVWIAHCPASNINLTSGIAPVRRYLDAGIRVGLGTDVAAGHSASMFRAVTDAIQVSKLYRRHVDPGAKPLTFPEGFYLASKGGGAFFGKAGSFEEGYGFDALVLDDSGIPAARELNVRDRLERAFYLELDRIGIEMKVVQGQIILNKKSGHSAGGKHD